MASLVDHGENAEVRWAMLAEAEELLIPTGGIWEPVRTYMEQAGVESAESEPSSQSAGQPSEELKPLAAAIIVRGDGVLLTERRYPGHGEQWFWPSGKIEMGESSKRRSSASSTRSCSSRTPVSSGTSAILTSPAATA